MNEFHFVAKLMMEKGNFLVIIVCHNYEKWTNTLDEKFFPRIDEKLLERL